MSLLKLIFVTVVSITLVSCGAPANHPNTEAAKPAAVAPTTSALLAFEKQANEAYIRGDHQFFEGILSEKMVMANAGQRMGKADVDRWSPLQYQRRLDAYRAANGKDR